MVAFLGDIRPYKGLDLLLDAYENTPPGKIALFVAGAFAEKAHDTAIRPRLADLAAKNHSIVFREGRLDDTALGDAIRACDVVALPYRAAWNSGLALLVAENGGRILASDWPVFRELQQEVGPEQVHLFGGELTAEMLIAAVENEPATMAEGESSFFTTRSWPRIGAETVAFYRRLGARPLSPQSRETSHEA
jgi:glycosyltransferase involved in cell wall biosynthesis